jgi:hypothetical protein
MILMMAAMGFSAVQNMEAATDPSASAVLGPLAWAGAIIYIAAVSLVWPLMMTVNIVHYNSLRSEKENVDIDSQLDELDAPGSTNGNIA